MSYYFHVSELVFWSVFKSEYVGSGLPMLSFIDVFVLEQRLQKTMEWKDLIFLHFFPFYYLLHDKA